MTYLTLNPTDNQLVTRADLRLPTITFNLYREIHKAIRRQLFGLTHDVGCTDPSDEAASSSVAERVHETAFLLEQHAAHEDVVIQPSLELYLPELAAVVERDHQLFERRVYGLVSLAEEVAQSTDPVDPRGSAGCVATRRHLLHELYLGLSAFTGAYLIHQDLEEREIMPGLERTVGVDAVLGMHTAIVTSIPPDEMARTLAVMLPAMNVEDRVEMYAGMKAGAPPEAFGELLEIASDAIGAKETQRLVDRLNASATPM